MSFNSLDRVLRAIAQQTNLQQQPIQLALKYWAEAVGEVVAAHTQLLSIQRDVLWVATSSASWAQTLTFERQRILAKLNQKLPSPLTDIRFSTAQWQRNQATYTQEVSGRNHPSSFPAASQTAIKGKCPDPRSAFAQWVKTTQERSHNLPLCPQCQSPTPPGELERWQVCCLCAAKEF
ncbi:DUF721 domain-containing protein [Aliterella atlantica]|uniref:RNA-binding protein containing Zn ribbon n=1 Tax=Aliterella atlantica CENA595 TaxID=1618023 RepID=A0A0D8ZU29_9CYAN|nr:DciA family protein [Aliterella atlantica]KJH72273.1 RNA-binding protein containing Zn ribbon [Aliterella atlantica CENA595]